MPYVFIIEGADKCGKSELSKHLIDKFKCNYVHNGKYRENPFRNYDFAMNILKSFEGQPCLLLDRYVLSNYVYSNVFKDGEDPLPYDVFQAYRNHFDRVARLHGYIPVWIVCTPNKETWKATFEKSVNQGNELYTSLEKMEEVYNLMEGTGVDEHMYMFDWTQDSNYQNLDAYLEKIAQDFDLNYAQDPEKIPLNENTKQIAELMSYYRMLKDSNEPLTNGTYEILNHHFIMDPREDIEFTGYKVNREYHKKELDWYLSLDRSIKGWMDDVTIWANVASKDDKREINSNYGWCVFSPENGDQYNNALEALKKDPNTRQAQIIYTRPSMHKDWCEGGRHDFICTNTVQLFIRNDMLFYKIDQRSLDTTTGLRADWYWHIYVYEKALKDLQETFPNLRPGKILWNVGSCHIYERSFKVLDKITDAL